MNTSLGGRAELTGALVIDPQEKTVGVVTAVLVDRRSAEERFLEILALKSLGHKPQRLVCPIEDVLEFADGEAQVAHTKWEMLHNPWFSFEDRMREWDFNLVDARDLEPSRGHQRGTLQPQSKRSSASNLPGPDKPGLVPRFWGPGN